MNLCPLNSSFDFHLCELIVKQLLWAHNSSPVADSVGLFDDYEVWVVQPVNVLTDALVYVLLSSQVMMSEKTS